MFGTWNAVAENCNLPPPISLTCTLNTTYLPLETLLARFYVVLVEVDALLVSVSPVLHGGKVFVEGVRLPVSAGRTWNSSAPMEIDANPVFTKFGFEYIWFLVWCRAGSGCIFFLHSCGGAFLRSVRRRCAFLRCALSGGFEQSARKDSVFLNRSALKRADFVRFLNRRALKCAKRVNAHTFRALKCTPIQKALSCVRRQLGIRERCRESRVECTDFEKPLR